MTEKTQVPDKGDDIEAILAQFDDDGEKAKPGTEEKPDPSTRPTVDDIDTRLANHPVLKEVQDYVKDARAERVRTEIDREVDAMIASNESLQGVDKTAIRFLMEGEAQRDPRIRNAFFNKNQKPEEWGKIRGNLAGRISDMIAPARADRGVSDDREAFRSAVRGRSPAKGSKAEDDENARVPFMTEQEFDTYWKKVHPGMRH